ncbi:MAG: ribosomal L7Ae/L30e/S12e/Gadd45 family protein [Clostridia bacterium]|nr:ribosomal L7Ae/L30e/S12e/Gadd45 family protein [Clostridia bacterium]MDD4047343.1 ribosomal L7Ae/L30e/S12e/Gadd45 family protein [Clostridia bacterium]
MKRLREANKKTVGFKQTIKAIDRGQTHVIYIAKDAEDKIRIPIMEKSVEREIAVVEVESMMELGKACGVQVGASVVAVLD